MKKLLGRREKRIWLAATVVLAAAWVLMAASMSPAFAQEGPGLGPVSARAPTSSTSAATT